MERFLLLTSVIAMFQILLINIDRERRAFLAKVFQELRTPVSKVKVTPEALVRVASQEPLLCDCFIAIDYQIPDVNLQLNSERLLQALLNILANAIKYSLPGSRIVIDGYRKNDWMLLQIQDWGIGISKTDLPRVFKEFYRADSSRQKEGIGLSLAISQRIVEAHGGKMAIKSLADREQQ